MSTLKRITPEQVKAAFEKLGWEPARGCFYMEWTDRTCACPMTAVLVADGGARAEDFSHFTAMKQYFWSFGLNDHYTSGFIQGWDNTRLVKSPILLEDPGDPEAERLGRLDGRAAAKHMGLIVAPEEDNK